MKQTIKYETFDGKLFDDAETAESYERAQYIEDIKCSYYGIVNMGKKINALKHKILPGIEKALHNSKSLSKLNPKELDIELEKLCIPYAEVKILHNHMLTRLKGKSRHLYFRMNLLHIKSTLVFDLKKLRHEVHKEALKWKDKNPGKNVLEEYKKFNL